MVALRKKGVDIQPIEIEGRKIARTFWGEGWCNHLESFSDYDNRLPRGRTYVRNGSVCHLAIKKGKVEAKVSGSDIYEVRVKIKTLSNEHWKKIQQQCSGQIGSLLELLEGKLSDNIMSVVTDRKTGIFPKPAEIAFDCDCPDYATMCKHVAAVLYGVGARLDNDPALLFQLRGVKHEELVENQIAAPAATGKGKSKRLADDNLGDVFGIDLDTTGSLLSKPKTVAKTASGKAKASTKKRPTKKRPTKKQTKAKKVSVKKQTNKKATPKSSAKKKPAPAKAAKTPNSKKRKSPIKRQLASKE
jgi:uncharacterized Zn finger protein